MCFLARNFLRKEMEETRRQDVLISVPSEHAGCVNPACERRGVVRKKGCPRSRSTAADLLPMQRTLRSLLFVAVSRKTQKASQVALGVPNASL